jgi:hypothetical protein
VRRGGPLRVRMPRIVEAPEGNSDRGSCPNRTTDSVADHMRRLDPSFLLRLLRLAFWHFCDIRQPRWYVRSWLSSRLFRCVRGLRIGHKPAQSTSARLFAALSTRLEFPPTLLAIADEVTE